MPNFDADSVRLKADDLVRADKANVEDARQLFLEEIMDWSDYYTENAGSSSAEEMQAVLDAIVNLWVQCANFEVSLHQFKKAVDVFDKAILDPICSKSVSIFRAYASFCVDRKKPGNAQNVYIKGLCAGMGESDNQTLWDDFLTLMHGVNKSANLTMEQLYEAVRSQDGVDEALLAVPAGVQLSAETADVDISIDEIDANEGKEEEDEAVQVDIAAAVSETAEQSHAEPQQLSSTEMETEQAAPRAEESTQSAEVPTVLERRYAELDGLDDVSGFTPEQVIRTFTARPPMLFTSLQKEPTASGIAALSVDPGNPAAAELEAFLGAPLAELPNRTPNMHAEPRDYASWTAADRYLDLLEAMWLAQALKERHFDSWISDLRNMHIEQEASLVDSFLDTESEAAAGKSAEEKAAIKKRQHSELMIFRNHCAVQQELLHAIINKALLALLVEQQTQLAQIGFPRFTLQFVETLKAYVQTRKSAAPAGKVDFDAALVKQVLSQRELVCAFLSVRLQTVSTERSRAAQLTKTKLSRAQSIDQESEAGSDLNYFDAEAKKRRKRRRIILQHHNDSYSHTGVSSYGSLNSPGGGYYSEQLSPRSDSGVGGSAGGYPPAFRGAGAAGAHPQQFARPQQQHAYPQVSAGGEGSVVAPPSSDPAAAAAAALSVLQKLSAQIKPRR